MQTAERVFSRGWSTHEALLHDRPADRGRGGRARDPAASAAARAPSASRSSASAGRGRAAPEGHRERLDPRAQAAHALPVVRDGHARRRCAQSSAGSRRRRGAAKRRPQDARLRHVVARGASSRAATARSRPCSSARTARGARFDSWEDQKRIDVWEEAFAAEGVDAAQVPRARIPVTARLPWDHIDVGLEEGFLAARVPQGAQEPPVAAVRQGRRRVRARDRTSTTRRPTRASSSATTAASRATCARCASSASCTCASSAPKSRARPAPRRVAAHARRARRRKHRRRARPRRYRFVYEKLGPRRVPVAPRRHPRAAARVPPARAAALLLAGLPPQAGHDVRAGAVARRREPRARSST